MTFITINCDCTMQMQSLVDVVAVVVVIGAASLLLQLPPGQSMTLDDGGDASRKLCLKCVHHAICLLLSCSLSLLVFTIDVI